MNPPNEESHPFLPSGEWEGFYCYKNDTEQHRMSLTLSFINGAVNGDGIDDLAPFTWKGYYDLSKFKIEMDKKYPTHAILYKGDIDENGIWGMWSSSPEIPSNISPELFNIIASQLDIITTGGFHIWPKKLKSKTNTAQEEIKESKRLTKLIS